MKRKLPLTIALAVLGATVTAGTAVGGSGSLIGVGEGGVQINLPEGGNLQNLELLPQCANTVDDDADGTVDLNDTDCTGPLDATESGSGAPAPDTAVPDGNGSGGQGGGTGGGGGRGDG